MPSSAQYFSDDNFTFGANPYVIIFDTLTNPVSGITSTDNAGMYDTGTGVITIPTAGDYLVSVYLESQSPPPISANSIMTTIQIQKNIDATWTTLFNVATSAFYKSAAVSCAGTVLLQNCVATEQYQILWTFAPAFTSALATTSWFSILGPA